ncbi:MAG: hypothetical protein IJA75_02420 [Oscillospiraceae bacterium]|nr:hypothetical protein [Oscillospiraceae bacterium]
MTHRERFIKTLKCEPIGGQVPTFELVFFLTMEAFGKVHPSHRYYSQWDQMSYAEKKLHIHDMADIYIDTARRYDHSAIFVHPNPGGFENVQWLLETIREKSGDEYYIMMHGDVTHSMPDGANLMDFCVAMLEEPEKLNDQSQRWLDANLELAQKLDANGHLLDGFALCSDYCFNTNPFFRPDQFEEFIVPYLKQGIEEYRKMGYYSIKHTDGNIMPILKQIADCKPDAIHSLDPQGGVSIPEVRRIVGDEICLIGNVNCGLLQTGTDEEMRADVLRSLREGMATGRGYIFSTSNCAYSGLPLERYETMIDLWRRHGSYDRR